MKIRWFICLPCLFLCGCVAVGPDYQRPDLSLAPQYIDGADSPVGEIAGAKWWEKFGDVRLNTLIERGLQQNLDVVAAQERIRQAAAALRATGVNAALSGSLGGSYTWAGGSDIETTHSAAGSLGAGFVVDLFGGIRREREQAMANLVYAETNVEVARLAWLAEFIADYANAGYYQASVALTEDTIKARQETVSITKRQFEAGAATEYGVAEAEALLATAQAALPRYTALFKSYVFAMATLLNEEAEPLLADMQASEIKVWTPYDDITTGLPADLLRTRPDIRSSEAELTAAVAAVGMAKADLYPSIALSGTLSLNEGGTSTWGFGPSLTLPVFNRGALNAAVDQKVSAAKQAEIAYRAAVLAAVQDVQVAQSNLQQYRERARYLEQASQSYKHAYELAQRNYKSGAITLLDLLDIDRSSATAAISAVSADNDAMQEWAGLQIAIGAGAAVVGDVAAPSGEKQAE